MGNAGAAAKGAAGGAATGAAIGSVVPGYGTAIGAGVGAVAGGLAGWFSDDDAKKSLADYGAATAGLGDIAMTAQGRMAPMVNASYLNRQYIDQSRGGLMDTAGRLQGIATGTQQGAGEMAVNAQLGRAAAAQNAAARMARGANAALAYRNAMRNQADMGLAGAAQAAQSRMQDQAQANAQLGQIYGSMYGQDAAIAGQNATLAQQAALANQGAYLTQQQLNDARQMQAYQQMLAWDAANNGQQIDWAKFNASQPNIGANMLQAGGSILTGYMNQQKAPSAPTAAPATAGSMPAMGTGPVTQRLSDF
jgi:hypothetical protein